MAAVDNLSGNFSAKMQQELGYPYLHYGSYQSADLGGASLERL